MSHDDIAAKVAAWNPSFARRFGAVVLGGVVLLGIAVVASPRLQYVLRVWFVRPQPHEPSSHLRRIFDGAFTFYYAEDSPPDRRFPVSSGGPHPPLHYGDCRPMSTDDWITIRAWGELEFDIDEKHRFHYQFDSSGTGDDAQFTASAFGDIDCDGVYSTWVRFGKVSGGEASGSNGLYIARELE